jgi:hypothetical protein
MRRFTRNPVCGTNTKPQHLVVPGLQQHIMLWFRRRNGSLCGTSAVVVPSLAMGHPTAAPADDRPLPFASRGRNCDDSTRARPTGVWRARTSYELAIEGRDRRLAAAVDGRLLRPRLEDRRHGDCAFEGQRDDHCTSRLDPWSSVARAGRPGRGGSAATMVSTTGSVRKGRIEKRPIDL